LEAIVTIGKFLNGKFLTIYLVTIKVCNMLASSPEMMLEKLGAVLEKIKQKAGCIDKTVACQKF
jgi:hypothetical protein